MISVYVDQSVCHAVQNAASVPQVAITVAITSNEASIKLHLPWRATLADIGPMTQIMKAENEPMNAMRELNSGTRTDTKIDSAGTDIRSTMKNTRFESRRAVES